MSDISAEEFAQRAIDSGLLTASQVESLWGDLSLREVPLQGFINTAIFHNFLTHWQVGRLLDGKRHGYFFGKYKVLYLIGAETLARVYRAEHMDTHYTAAVKVLRPHYSDDSGARHKFVAEAKKFACEVSMEGDRLYMVMDGRQN